MQNYFIIDFKAVSLADKNFRNIIVKFTCQLAAKNYKTAAMDFIKNTTCCKTCKYIC